MNQKLVDELRANNHAIYDMPHRLACDCYTPNAQAVALLVVALLEACKGPNAAHDAGACNRLLQQVLTGYSPEQISSTAEAPIAIDVTEGEADAIKFALEFTAKAQFAEANKAAKKYEFGLAEAYATDAIAMSSLVVKIPVKI